MPRKAKGRRKTKRRKTGRPSTRTQKAAASPNKLKLSRKQLYSDRIETAVREMNRGQSLTATARSLHLPPKSLQAALKRRRLGKREGRRWVTRDNRLRRVPVMTGGRLLKLTVRGYEPARLVGEHHNAAWEFVSRNDIKLIELFRGQTVQAVNGRRYVLETDPNALHRIAAMDSPPFHEIYEITSNT